MARAAAQVPEATSDLDRILSVTAVVTLLSGIRYEVLRIKTRQFFRLMRILTHGAGERVLRGALDFTKGGDEFASSLMQVLLLSIPDAEDETIFFVQSMLRPLDLFADREDYKVTKDDEAADKVKWGELSKDTFNPELEDLVTIFDAIVKQEAPEIQALGKRLGDLLQAQFPSLRPSKDEKKNLDSSEATPELSTQSAGTTDGPTT